MNLEAWDQRLHLLQTKGTPRINMVVQDSIADVVMVEMKFMKDERGPPADLSESALTSPRDVRPVRLTRPHKFVAVFFSERLVKVLDLSQRDLRTRSTQ